MIIEARESLTRHTDEEISDYKENIKDRCFICGYVFKNSLQEYMVRGNCCTTCSVRISDYFRRTITKEECDLRLVERIAFLKNNQ